MRFNERVEKYSMQFNDTDDEIVEFIQKNQGEIMSVSIQKMAKELYIAPNAIMRFSKKIGYSGFAELKFAVQSEQLPNEQLQSEMTSGRKLMDLLPSNIVKTLDIIDATMLEKVARVMHRGKCCIFAGVGDSTYFCEILGKNLRCIDYKVQYYQQIHDMIYAVEHGDKDEVLIIISARGTNERLICLAKRAKEIGMKVISITHMSENPLASEADYSLYFWGEERTVQGYNVTDRTGLMVLVRLLSEAFWKGYDE